MDRSEVVEPYTLDADYRVSRVLFRKFLSLAMSFNALIALVAAGRNLFDLYLCRVSWNIYSPYLLDGNLLWAVVLSSVMNLLTSVRFGRVRIKQRLLFHHYVYGFIVIVLSVLVLNNLYQISLIQLFTKVYFTGDYTIFVLFFFVMGGIVLIIDDWQDIKPLKRLFSPLAIDVKTIKRPLRLIKCLLHTLALYISLCILLWILDNPWRLDPSWIVYIGSLFINSLLGFITAIWLKPYVTKKIFQPF